MIVYWGKKILEWTSDPGEEFDFALYLNNKYLLDGRDPNSLRRKFRIDAYVEKVTRMVGQFFHERKI